MILYKLLTTDYKTLKSSGQQSSYQTLGLLDRDQSIAPQVEVESNEKLLSETTATSTPQQNPVNNLWDLSTDDNFNSNSNNDDLLDLGNGQMSTFFQEYSNGQQTLWNEKNKNPETNYKTINGLGFYFCDSCPFLCLSLDLFLEHKKKDYHFRQSPLTSLLKFKCIGCDNIFYSIIVLRYHLLEDHDCSSVEVEGLIQIIIEANKEENLYMNDEIPQTRNQNLADFNNTNDTIFSTSENNESSHFMNTQITGENIFVDNSLLNETSVFCGHQEQVFNGMQGKNTNNDQNIINKFLRCSIESCKIRFGTEENLQYHMQCHLDDGFRCMELDCQHFDTKWLSMLLHLWRTHNINIEMFSCDQCRFKTTSLYRLNNYHINIHNKEKPFMCPDCTIGFRTNKQLKNHRVIHQKIEKPATSDLTCLHCSRNFISKNSLHRHTISTHTEIRSYSCDVCNYTTAVSSSLRLHMRLHTGEKPFKCSHCCFSSSDHNTLRKHKMRHTGQKNYKCPFCDYSCIQSSSYKKHLKKKHPGMDDGIMYSCNLCNFKTISKDIYMIHIFKHNQEPVQNNVVCEAHSCSDVIFNEKEKKQAENVENSNLFNTITVNPLNTMQPNETT